MDGTAFVAELRNGPDMEPEDNVFRSIWAEYERVILQSLVTSFGLDFLVHDQHGGDVDTIHNVREIGSDSKMEYSNSTCHLLCFSKLSEMVNQLSLNENCVNM